MKLAGQVALVTGGNSGIGRAIALCFAAEGARLAITGRDREKGARVLAELIDAGADAAFFPFESGDESIAIELIAAVAARFGRIDVVVNNVGAGARRSAVEAGDSPGVRLEKLLRANLFATYLVSSHSLPWLRAAGGGCIVNISSTAALHGSWGSYGVAKAAIEAFTRALAVQGAPDRIRANGISPGWVATQATQGIEEVDRDASLFGRMGTPDEIARVALFLASEDASFVTGQTLIVDGGLTIVDYPSRPWLDAAGMWKLFPDMLPKP